MNDLPTVFHDVRIVSLEQSVAGPLCTRLFADLGARVIKIEKPGVGDFARSWDNAIGPWSSTDLWVNPNKESVTLDLKSERGRELLMELVGEADVFLESFKPGVVKRLGLDYESIRKVRPEIVYCHISGYGQDGPYRDKRAMDSLIQGEAGLIGLTGSADEPARLAASVADVSAGLYAAFAVSAALFHARRTGDGQELDVSMLETTASLLGYWASHHLYREQKPRRMGMHHPLMAPYGVYKTSDGFVNLCVSTEPMWPKFCDAIGHPELSEIADLSTNDLRLINRDQMNPTIADALAKQSRAHWLQTLEAAGVPCAAINDLGEVIGHPQIEHRGLVETTKTEHGDVCVFGFPVKMSRTPAAIRKLPPELGEHTSSVMEEIGCDDAEIDQLRSDGVI